MTTDTSKNVEQGKRALLHCWWECKLQKSRCKSIWWFLRKLGIVLPRYPAIPPLRVYPKDAPSYHKNTWSTMFIVALFVIARNWKQTRNPSSHWVPTHSGNQVSSWLSTSSSTEARQGSPGRGIGSTGRQQSQGKPPLQLLGDLHEDQAVHLLLMCILFMPFIWWFSLWDLPRVQVSWHYWSSCGYTGTLCERNINECSSNPGQFGGEGAELSLEDQ